MVAVGASCVRGASSNAHVPHMVEVVSGMGPLCIRASNARSMDRAFGVSARGVHACVFPNVRGQNTCIAHLAPGVDVCRGIGYGVPRVCQTVSNKTSEQRRAVVSGVVEPLGSKTGGPLRASSVCMGR